MAERQRVLHVARQYLFDRVGCSVPLIRNDNANWSAPNRKHCIQEDGSCLSSTLAAPLVASPSRPSPNAPPKSRPTFTTMPTPAR